MICKYQVIILVHMLPLSRTYPTEWVFLFLVIMDR
nr:MAG TPA: hypothetical protein [Caudoviricetes sp.]